MNDSDELKDRRYILQCPDGDFIATAKSTGMEAMKMAFTYSKDEAGAKVFSYEDLYSPLAVNPVGIEFSRGFAGGRLIRIK